jgi:hypothetical protein
METPATTVNATASFINGREQAEALIDPFRSVNALGNWTYKTTYRQVKISMENQVSKIDFQIPLILD